MNLRILWSVAIAACGSRSPAVDSASQPQLVDDHAVAATGDASTEVTVEMTVLIDQQCVPPATYTVTYDQMAAEVVTRSATPRARCVELADQLPKQQSLTLDYRTGQPHVTWNGPMHVDVVDACAFAIVGDAGRASISFRNGKGRGVATLELGEGCVARAVRLVLER
jgi:hypothetical protein